MAKKSKCEKEILERISTAESRIQGLNDEKNDILRAIDTEENTLAVLMEIRDSVNVKGKDKNEQAE